MPATPAPANPARRRRAIIGSAVAGGALLAAVAVPSIASAGDTDASRHRPGHGHGRTLDLQMLAVNDLHGNVEAPAGSSGQVTETDPVTGKPVKTDAGGLEYLATSLRKARAGHRNSMTFAAGDMVGASPMLSGLFHDEPTVESLNRIGLDASGVGNHEFDEGAKELIRLQNGGCHPVEGCFDKGRKFAGADYPILAANVTWEKTQRPILKPYTVVKQKGVKVGVIGVTLEGTPNVVTAEGVKGLKFHDEIKTVNKYAKELRKKGVRSIVALIHEGGMPPADSTYDYNCDTPGPGAGISGPIVDIAKGIDSEVDALITGHTHQSYTCTIPDPSGKPRTVTSAASFGKVYTELNMKYDRRTKDIVRTAGTSTTAKNHVVRRTQPKAPDITRGIDYWKKLAAPIADRPVGYIAEDINGRGSTALEKPLGDLIADAQLTGLAPADKGGAQLALMNPGGIRADLVYKAAGGEGDGVVSYGDAFTVQPFTNMMNVVTLTGAQLTEVLQQQVSGANEASPRILQISEGLTYTLDLTKSGAARVVADSIKLNGQPLDAAKGYRVAMNEFLSGGGDGFPTLAKGTDKLVGASDLDVFTGYLTAKSTAGSPLKAPAANRITVIK
jgi:5'-nucleotidase